MMDFVATFQHWLTLACFVALAVCLFALAVLCAIPELTAAIRRFCGMDNFSKIVCGVCIVGAVLYGGSKGVNVRWDDGLRDNGTLITNDTVAVRWTYSGIPGASSVFIDYREAGTTNDWLNLAETLASAQEWTGTLANATNYDYWVYSTYVPPVPVHTNGVWVGQAYETKAKVGAAAFLILNGKVVADGRTIAPPKWAEPLPYDAEVEYLEGTGTQYIDTGVYSSGGMVRYELDFMPLVSKLREGVRQAFFGLSNSGSRWFGVSQTTLRNRGLGIGLGSNSIWTEILPLDRYVVAVATGSATVNGTSVGTPGSVNVSRSGNLYLFAINCKDANGVSTVSPQNCRVYGLKIYGSGGVLVLDFIPVRKDGVGYMYDRVSGQLFGNNGTGAFGVGPDK